MISFLQECGAGYECDAGWTDSDNDNGSDKKNDDNDEAASNSNNNYYPHSRY